jgi:hypothetical protein
LGIHVSVVRDLVQQAKAIDASATTAADICRVLVAPATAQLPGADPDKTYLRLLEGKTGTDGRPLVAPSTHFVSHAWKYDLAATVLEVMEEMDRETGGTAYFW